MTAGSYIFIFTWLLTGIMLIAVGVLLGTFFGKLIIVLGTLILFGWIVTAFSIGIAETSDR